MSTIVLPKGTWLQRTITFLDPSGAAYDLTGASIWFTVKKSASDADFVLQYAVSAGITITGPGTAEVSSDTGDTLLTYGNYHYNVQIRKAGWPDPIETEKGTLVVTKNLGVV
jgi:hypothetical protein